MSENIVEAIEKRNKEYLESLQGNIGKYLSFLSTMARFHKYEVKDLASFALEAPAIYTAVASEELWKKHFNRKINAKARGITLIKNGKPVVYYDVSETENQNNEVKLWKYEETKHKRFLNAVVTGETDTKKQIRIISEEMARRSDIAEKDQKILALSVEAVILERMGFSTENATRQLARLSFENHDMEKILEKTQETAKEFLDAMQRAVSQDEFSEENVNKPKNNPLLQEIGVIRLIKETEQEREEKIELEEESIQSKTFDNFEVEQVEESINQENVTEEYSEYISNENDDEIENSFEDKENHNFVEENAEQEKIETIDDEESAEDDNVYAEDENIVSNAESEGNNEFEDDVETIVESEEIEENQVDEDNITSDEEAIENDDDISEESQINSEEVEESSFGADVENTKDEVYDAENPTTEFEKTNDTDDNKKDEVMANMFEDVDNDSNLHQTDPDYDYEEDDEMEEEEEILPEDDEIVESNEQEPQKIVEDVENEEVSQVENAEIVAENLEEEKDLKKTIEEDMLEIQGNSAEKTIFRNNVIAIRTLQNIKSENREATPEDIEALKKYAGFGGIPKAFEKSDPEWSREAWLLEKILTKKEYEAARGSTLNAHYTSANIIHGMYEGLEKLGFKSGTILEPSMGVGRFFGEMPAKMSESSHLYGVELDSLTGEMAKILYPEAEINITGFEKTKYANNSFDVAVGNVPFGSYKVNDKDYNGHGFLIHDYFIAKMIDQVRPGGIVAVITSRGTLDKKDSSARKYFAERADLVRAIRLPNNAFKEARTEVTSDILFFKKLEKARTAEEKLPNWVNTEIFQGNNDITLNHYFLEHPEDVLGKLEVTSTAYGYDLTCKPDEERPFDETLSKLMESMPKIYEVNQNELPLPKQALTKENINPSSFFEEEGEIKFFDGVIVKPIKANAKDREKILRAMAMRDAVRTVINIQLEDGDENDLKNAQDNLNNAYDRYVRDYGHICEDSNLKKLFGEDSAYPLLRSLEEYDKEGFKAKSPIFSRRMIEPHRTPTHADNPSDALAISMQEHGRVSIEYMAELTGQSKEEIIKELEYQRIYFDFQKKEYQIADEYLSGDIRAKMEFV